MFIVYIDDFEEIVLFHVVAFAGSIRFVLFILLFSDVMFLLAGISQQESCLIFYVQNRKDPGILRYIKGLTLFCPCNEVCLS